jgi:hypothetical protein
MAFWTCFASAYVKVTVLSNMQFPPLTSCIENDTLARIGTSCLQQLLENNVAKLSPARWDRVATTFVKLFRTTTPHQLFDETLRVEIDGGTPDLPEGMSLYCDCDTMLMSGRIKW